jgi:hypothetical protein
MALAVLRPLQMYIRCVVFDINFNIMHIFNSKYDLKMEWAADENYRVSCFESRNTNEISSSHIEEY